MYAVYKFLEHAYKDLTWNITGWFSLFCDHHNERHWNAYDFCMQVLKVCMPHTFLQAFSWS